MQNDAFSQYQLGQMGVRTGNAYNEVGLNSGNPPYHPVGYTRSRRRRAPKPPPKWLTNPETDVEHAKLAALNWCKQRRQTWIFWLLGLGVIATVIIANLPASTNGVLGIGASAPPVPWLRLSFAGFAGLVGWAGVWVALSVGIPSVVGAWVSTKDHWSTRWFRAGIAVTSCIFSATVTAAIAGFLAALTVIMVHTIMNV